MRPNDCAKPGKGFGVGSGTSSTGEETGKPGGNGGGKGGGCGNPDSSISFYCLANATLELTTTVIELREVSKEYDGKRSVSALSGVSLRIEKGDMVALVGPSGSGKSTLLNLAGGLDRATKGQVLIDGTALDSLDDDGLTKVRRDKIGIIFQFFHLMPTLSCLENVGLPLHLRGWPRAKIDERARELLGLVKLSERLEHLPDELSGGERQRVAIARALSIYPPVLLADEPTGNLDSQTAVEILALLRDVNTKLGATVLMVTHDRSVAASCTRVISLRDGRIEKDERQ